MRYLVMSDLHLGHNKNNANYIIAGLNKFFLQYRKTLLTIDILFIAGDLFDKLLATNSNDYILINKWLINLIKFVSANSIKLRVLHGTLSHDQNQFNVFYNILSGLKIDIDFKYYDDVAIETINDVVTLYVPDEFGDTDDILKAVKSKLALLNLTSIDIAIMHGNFDYQLPITLPSALDSKRFLNLITGPISIGHIHTHSVFKRIIAQGSFDRLHHNEEEDKGAVVIDFNPLDKTYSFNFLTNNNTMIFKTININNFTIERVKKLLLKYEHIGIKLDKPVNIRLLTADDVLKHNILELKKEFSYIRISFKSEAKDDDIILKLVIEEHKDIKVIDNKLIREFVHSKVAHLESVELQELIKKELEELINV